MGEFKEAWGGDYIRVGVLFCSLSIYLSHLILHLSVCLSVCLSVPLTVCLTLHHSLTIHVLVDKCTAVQNVLMCFVLVCICLHMYIYVSVCLSTFVSVCLLELLLMTTNDSEKKLPHFMQFVVTTQPPHGDTSCLQMSPTLPHTMLAMGLGVSLFELTFKGSTTGG